MKRPVGEHIRRLEEQIQMLNQQAMDDALSQEERNRIESEIRVVTLALSQYPTAVKLE